MKKNIYKHIASILMLALCVACGSDGDGDAEAPEVENEAPNAVASLTFPTNNLLCTSDNLEFSWGAATDPNSGDVVSYVLEISKDAQFTTIDITETSSSPFKSVSLEKGTIYYWRVKAKDDDGLESDYSEVFQFYTEDEAEVNHLPFPAQVISPTIDALLSDASTTLEWNASDVDEDPLTYDVYFDTVNPPVTQMGNNQSEETLSVDLSAATTYYWYVVTKDDKRGQSIGQVWNFTTN